MKITGWLTGNRQSLMAAIDEQYQFVRGKGAATRTCRFLTFLSKLSQPGSYLQVLHSETICVQNDALPRPAPRELESRLVL